MTPNSSPGGHRDRPGGATNEPSALAQRPAGRSEVSGSLRGTGRAVRDMALLLASARAPRSIDDTGPEPRALATYRTSPPCSESPQLPRHSGLRDGTTSSSATERRSRRRGGCSASTRARPAAPDCPVRGPAKDYRCGPEASCRRHPSCRRSDCIRTQPATTWSASSPYVNESESQPTRGRAPPIRRATRGRTY